MAQDFVPNEGYVGDPADGYDFSLVGVVFKINADSAQAANRRAPELARRLSEVVEEFPDVELHTSGRHAIVGFQAAFELAVELERSRAARQAASS